jgi:hypothetical protein
MVNEPAGLSFSVRLRYHALMHHASESCSSSRPFWALLFAFEKQLQGFMQSCHTSFHLHLIFCLYDNFSCTASN